MEPLEPVPEGEQVLQLLLSGQLRSYVLTPEVGRAGEDDQLLSLLFVGD